MIGHNAIGGYGKTATSRFRTKHLQQPKAASVVCEDFATIKAADRDEIELLTNVVNRIETNIFGAEHGNIKDRPWIVAESGVSVLCQRARFRKRALQNLPRIRRQRLTEGRVLVLRVYANGNYWTATGWKNDAVSDFD